MNLPLAAPSPWELAAETIAVKIRWFGLLIGYAVVNLGDHPFGRLALLDAILTLGAAYTLVDTLFSLRGRVFLRRDPLVISVMEALFIALLCFWDTGLESPFRYYYFLSLICCAVRHSSQVTYATCALHCVSYGLLYLALPSSGQRPFSLALTLVMLAWVTYASSALASLLKRVGEHLGRLNDRLRDQQSKLELNIAERTAQLQEAQAHVLHQEKMAAFGLLAAGIAHEVGNPLTSISTLIQMLERRDPDEYTRERLALVTTQLTRIQSILRELVTFSRPASDTRDRVSLQEIVGEALGIAKYYKGVKGRIIRADIPNDLPPILGIRDQLVQIFFNLVLNAIDATSKGGSVAISAYEEDERLVVVVSDDGHGIDPKHRERLFRPYFTTKKHGTGLGLFVTQKLVRAHGGTVECESTPGEGTTFTLVFPLLAERRPAMVPALAASNTGAEPPNPRRV
jgi:two-component system, NtrC family, sensor kinase